MSPEPRMSFFTIREPVYRDIPAWLSILDTPFFSIIRSDIIKTKLQVTHAYSTAMQDSGEMTRIRKPESIFLMLMSGMDQIKTAIEYCGLSSDTKNVCVVYDNRNHYQNFISKFGNRLSETFVKVPDDDPLMDREIFSKITYTRMRIRN